MTASGSDGEERRVLVSLRRLERESQPVVLVVARDVTRHVDLHARVWVRIREIEVSESGERKDKVTRYETTIDLAHAGRLFEPFERPHEPSAFPGAGVGLAAVARAVQRHGGRVWAESAPGHGATFRFTLG